MTGTVLSGQVEVGDNIEFPGLLLTLNENIQRLVGWL